MSLELAAGLHKDWQSVVDFRVAHSCVCVFVYVRAHARDFIVSGVSFLPPFLFVKLQDCTKLNFTACCTKKPETWYILQAKIGV